MFPSHNSDNTFESLFKKCPSSSSSFPSDHQNPNDLPYLFNFPSPFLDEHESPLNQILLQNHQLMASGNNKYANSTTKQNEPDQQHQQIKSGPPSIRRPRNLGVVPRRRTGKKDRHSKICTAQGIRDRRMRLSLQVARKFFDLQDMLGFDKASKTIEWLFVQSKKAIKELTDTDAKSESFVSECDEVVSGLIEENSNTIDVKESIVPNETTPFCDERENTTKKSVSIRESARDRARARARWRTREKMMIKRLGDYYYPGPNSDGNQKLGFSSYSSFDQEGVDQDSNLNSSIFEQQFADVGTIEKLLGNSSSSNSCPNISDYHRSGGISGNYNLDPNFNGLLGNWDLLSNEKINYIHYEENPNYIYSGTQ